MIKKITALLLAVLCTVPYLTSCGGGNGNEGATLSQEAVTYEIDSELITDVDKYINKLSEDWFDDCAGKTFTWCGNQWQYPEKEEETGDIRNDALYFRQREIEEKFGITWNNVVTVHDGITENYSVYDYVMADVMSGNGAYNACYGTTIQVVQPLLVKNTLYDVSNYDIIDFDREWWPKHIEDNYSINGSMYFLNGPIVTTYYEDTYCFAFNKQIVLDYGIENLYDLVYNDEWTFDKMFEVASVIPQNENGAGAYRFGNPSGLAAMYAHGITLTSYDETGSPYIETAIPKELYDLSEKLCSIYADDSVSANIKYRWGTKRESVEKKYGFENFNEMFERGDFLFYNLTTGDAAELRKYKVEFGILPMPKGDKNQENYISSTDNWGTVNVFVPKSNKDHEFTDLMIEVLAALGRKYIKPAYYDKLLKYRSMYDHDSRDMIDIIFESKIYDLVDFLAVEGGINQETDFVKVVIAGLQENNDSFTSRYMLQAKNVNRSIKSLLENIEKDQLGTS
ncbi:MAG: hypothetical protein IKM46_09420 [Clostridia bacterium]|nr:hypothetical protein [Clostridia bacterium]